MPTVACGSVLQYCQRHSPIISTKLHL